MAALTLASIKTAFYAVLKSDSAGAAVRASLGAGSAGVLLRRGLSLTLPVAPFLVITFGPMTGAREDVRTLFPTVWLYDDPIQDWARLHALAALTEAVYVDDVIAYCYTNYAGGIGEEVIDAALQQRPALALRYQVRGRF